MTIESNKNQQLQAFYKENKIKFPKSFLDREIILYEKKEEDIKILISANEALKEEIIIQDNKNKKREKNILMFSLMNALISVSLIMGFSIVDSQNRNLFQRISTLESTDLALENISLREKIDNRKCLFFVCLK